MTRTSYFVASTVDGFIATPDDGLDWLVTRDQGADAGGTLGYEAFIAQVGAIAMGAATYEWLLRHHGDEPWFYSQPCWVFTHRDLPLREGADLRLTQSPVAEVHAEMAAAAGEKNIWIVGGGELVAQFHDAGLLDEVLISVAPLTIGAGKPLLPRHVELAVVESRVAGEFVVTRYRTVR
ncbi:dihydrofolate reductase family protein [Nocardioides sp. Bht2]|uniref:dihydrofolate reductase family protein n=1 Tax=Nocardioides sp. Bht2 TaxID=3392297 RepID=UPI0039B3B6D8